MERKRDQKVAQKATEKAGKRVCFGCKKEYHKLKTPSLCHNCQKIYEAVSDCVALNQGEFLLDLKNCVFKLTCFRGHRWETEFMTKE